MKIVRPNYDVTPLPPEVEAAWAARAEAFFARCRADHDALSARNVAAVLDREAAQASAAPATILRAA